MSLLDSVKSLVFEQETEKVEPTQPTEPNQQAVQNTASQPTATVQPTVSVEQQQMLAGLLAHLNEAVFARTTTFVQFNNTLRALEPVIADTATRYKAAFATMAASGTNADALLNAIKVHEADLESEINRFREDAERQKANKVNGPTNMLEDLKRQQESDQQLLETITTRMQQRVQQMADAQVTIDSALQNMTNVMNTFELAVNQTRVTMRDASQNIQTYLK